MKMLVDNLILIFSKNGVQFLAVFVQVKPKTQKYKNYSNILNR